MDHGLGGSKIKVDLENFHGLIGFNGFAGGASFGFCVADTHCTGSDACFHYREGKNSIKVMTFSHNDNILVWMQEPQPVLPCPQLVFVFV